jgi:ketosteroid isomerase-like protein
LSASVVREIIDALNRADVDGVLARMDPQFEWRPLEDSPVAGTYRGHGQVRRYIEDWLTTFEGVRLDVEELRELGERVVAVVRNYARARQSGLELQGRFCQVWTVRGGTAVEMQEYATRGEALAALPSQRRT